LKNCCFIEYVNPVVTYAAINEINSLQFGLFRRRLEAKIHKATNIEKFEDSDSEDGFPVPDLNVVFLACNGVLQPRMTGVVKTWPGPWHLSLIKRILEICNAKVVISSSWRRENNSLALLIDSLRQNQAIAKTHDVIGITRPTVNDDDKFQRGGLIKDWLKTCPMEVSSWLAIDDTELGLPTNSFILTNPKLGLEEKHVGEAYQKMQAVKALVRRLKAAAIPVKEDSNSRENEETEKTVKLEEPQEEVTIKIEQPTTQAAEEKSTHPVTEGANCSVCGEYYSSAKGLRHHQADKHGWRFNADGKAFPAKRPPPKRLPPKPPSVSKLKPPPGLNIINGTPAPQRPSLSKLRPPPGLNIINTTPHAPVVRGNNLSRMNSMTPFEETLLKLESQVSDPKL